MKTFLISGVLLILVSCTKNKTESSGKISDCPNTCTNGECFDVFFDSKLKIAYSGGTSYKLDSFKTIRTEDNKTLDPNFQYSERGSLDNGEYPVFNDNFIS